MAGAVRGLLRSAARAGSLLAALALLGPATGAHAASLANVVLTDSSAVTSAGLEGPDFDVTTRLAETAACGAECSAFATRFSGAALAEADEWVESGEVAFEWSYSLTFDVDAGANEAWELAVDTGLSGALTLVDDSAGDATAELGGFTGSYSGPGTASGSLDGAGLGSLSDAGGGNQAGSGAASFVVEGVGAGSAELTFSASGRVGSSCGAFGACFFGGTAGDEAAVRFGETGTAPDDLAGGGFTANAYPGPDGRSLADHGHFASFSVATVPEPGSALLIALGLLGLARASRPRTA